MVYKEQHDRLIPLVRQLSQARLEKSDCGFGPGCAGLNGYGF